MLNEKQIAQEALNVLNTTTGLKGVWHNAKKDTGLDGQIELAFEGKKKRFFVQVKRELRNKQVDQLIEMADKYAPLMVIAETIFPTLKEKLREQKVGYIDAAGNIFANTTDLYIWIDGNKPAPKQKKPITNRAFTKTGLKTVFYLLLHQNAINLPYRTLANLTDVALGNINNVIEGLRDAGYILQVNEKTFKINKRKELLNRWIVGYQETLKPTLHLGNYKFVDRNNLRNWKRLELGGDETIWGGEPAADHYTNYIVPEKLTVYTYRKEPLIPKWKLIPDENGEVQFYRKFWKDLNTETEKYAPPLLVYADLMITNDPRCEEVAEIIYEKYLKHEFERY